VPELPEVEVVRRGLEQWVAGRTVKAVEVHHPRAVRRPPAFCSTSDAVIEPRPVST
jgi:formamidopyrimidine-DNA glycosylase